MPNTKRPEQRPIPEIQYRPDVCALSKRDLSAALARYGIRVVDSPTPDDLQREQPDSTPRGTDEEQD